MQIRKAQPNETGLVIAFYQSIIKKLNEKRYGLPWQFGVYPTAELLEAAIAAQTLHICLNGNEVIGAAILNQNQGKGYDQVPWNCNPSASQIGVIHLLCADPEIHKQGIGSALIRHLCSEACTQNLKSLRLDVLSTNQPAIKLYEKSGFHLTGTVLLNYPSTGLAEFRLYEFVVS